MAGVDLQFACNCDTLRGTLLDANAVNGNRVDCFCHDCRAAEVFSDQPDPAPGPVSFYQSVPHKIRFDAGIEHLAVFSFSETGVLRWQAQCCGTPLFTTLRNAKTAFIGIRTNLFTDSTPLGPVRTRAFVRKTNGKRGHEGFGRAAWSFATNALSARFSGKWKQTPFFDISTGQPSRPVRIVSDRERAALSLY